MNEACCWMCQGADRKSREEERKLLKRTCQGTATRLYLVMF